MRGQAAIHSAYTFRVGVATMLVKQVFDGLVGVAAGVTIFAQLGYTTSVMEFVSVTTLQVLQALAANTQTPASATSSILDDAEKVFKILAYVVGAAWVYFNFLRGRTYRERLEPRVTGELCGRNKSEYIRACVTVKNVGLGKVPIQQHGSGLRFLAWDTSDPTNWRHLTTKAVFERHQWIEPGETVEDHLFIAQDLSTIEAVKLDLSLTSGRIMWQAVAILTPKGDQHA